MELRRIDRLPPYVFSIVNEMKIEARRRGEDIIDLGMGNPDLATPQPIVDKLTEAAQNARNHRYSASRGITKLRLALSGWYERRFGVAASTRSARRSSPSAPRRASPTSCGCCCARATRRSCPSRHTRSTSSAASSPAPR